MFWLWYAGWLFSTELISPGKWYLELLMFITWPADIGKFVKEKMNE